MLTLCARSQSLFGVLSIYCYMKSSQHQENRRGRDGRVGYQSLHHHPHFPDAGTEATSLNRPSLANQENDVVEEL